MVNKTVISIIRITLTTILILSFFSLQEQDIVSADAAPYPGALASNLSSNLNQTKVRMEAETVVIAIPEQSANYGGHAVVTATFYMRNMGTETEEMNARFPMNMSEYSMGYEIKNGVEYCSYISNFPSIDNISVFINNEQVNIATTENDVDLHETMGAPEGTIRHIKCWAHFHVIFPPSEQVVIQIEYKVSGYVDDPRHISYKYIMQTGQGWYDTIGSADIVVKLPYELNEQNTSDISPDNYSFSDNTINWHFENFEPEENIQFEVIDPSIWSRVVRETANIEKNSEDGEAWGRLGMAYKDTVTDKKGFINTDWSSSPEFFNLSKEAYEHAIALNPDDVDWHFGYAELICRYSIWACSPNDGKYDELCNVCHSELQTVFSLDPNHPEATEFLNYLWNFTSTFGPSEEIPAYFLLSPLPTQTQTPTITLETPFSTATLPPTWTPSPTQTEISKSNTPIPTIDSYKSTNIEQNRLLFSIGANMLFLVIFIFAIRPNHSNKRGT